MSRFSGQMPSASGEVAHVNVLVVQRQDPADSALFKDLMRQRGALVSWERDLRHARQALASMCFDLVVTEPELPDGTGLALIADRADKLQRWATVLVTECGDVRSAVAAIRHGAFDVIERPGGPRQILDIVERCGSRARLQPAALRDVAFAISSPAAPAKGPGTGLKDAATAEQGGLDPIIGRSLHMQRLRQRVHHVAPIPTDVLVIGETGSGKDLVARQIHALSGRTGPMVALNCGAIPDALFESELFGHEAGSFTGASKTQMGKIEQAHRGTLFLDEVESMPMHQQVKLLRVLETRRVGRVGGRGETPVDFRVVAAAQERLDERCRQGRFRADLWHRLNVVTLDVPALRHRREDVVHLFEHCVAQACVRFGIKPASLPAVDAGRLAAHDWPGNVRELRHAAERHVLGLPLLPDDAEDAPAAQPLAQHLGHCEREMIRTSLDRHGYRLPAAAAELGISEKTLARRITAYQLAAGGRGRSGRAA